MTEKKTSLKTGMSDFQHAMHSILFIAGAYFISEPSWVPYQHFFKAFGEACVIALMVIYLVEIHSHKRLEETATNMIRKVGRNIFGLVYGHDLPGVLVTALEKTLQEPVYRDQMRLDLELTQTQLTRLDLVPEPVCKYSHTYSYELVNCSDREVLQPVRISLERDKWLAERIANNASTPVLEFILIGSTLYVHEDNEAKVRRQLTLPLEVHTKPLDDFVTGSIDGNNLVFAEPDGKIPPQGRLKIKFSGVLFKRLSDNEVWSTSFPTLGVDVSVTSLDFEIESRFPSDEHQTTNHSAMCSKWSYDLPLLAGQSVIFWWRPKKRNI